VVLAVLLVATVAGAARGRRGRTRKRDVSSRSTGGLSNPRWAKRRDPDDSAARGLPRRVLLHAVRGRVLLRARLLCARREAAAVRT